MNLSRLRNMEHYQFAIHVQEMDKEMNLKKRIIPIYNKKEN